MMKNWKTKAISAALALAVLVPTAAFATDSVTNNAATVPTGRGFGQHQPFNQEKQQEMQTKLIELVTKYTPDSLSEWKTTLAQQDQLMQQMKTKQPQDQARPQLSDEVKAKLDNIREGVKNGTLTQEKAQEQMKALGIEPRDKGGKDRPELSADVKAKLDTIRENAKNGKITQAEAQEQVKALGIEPREKGDKDHPQLSAETKAKLDSIREDVEGGKLTEEQAKAEMEKLGLKPLKDKNDLMQQFKTAVDDNDASKIKELLPQMLQDLKEKNQDLSNKLAESQN